MNKETPTDTPAPITDPEAVGYVNDTLRPGADQMAQLYYLCKPLLDEWNSLHMADKIPPGSSAPIYQSPEDTRHQPTADNCYGFVLQAQAFVKSMEDNNNANLTAVLLLAVNPNP